MNKLIIRAHPKSDSWYNFAIYSAIIEAATQAWHTVKTINLYTEYPQPFLEFRREPAIPYTKEIQDLISWANELIFVFPIRRIDCPAILKNFMDVNLAKGFWYTTNSKGKEVGLLQWRIARIVATAWWPSFFYPFIWFVSWTMGRLWYCGIKHISTNILSHTMKTSDERRKRYIAKVAKRCSK